MSTMKLVTSVYVAAASSDVARAARWSSLLAEAGITCTSSWIAEVAQATYVANPRGVDRTERARRAATNYDDLNRADLLWFLAPVDAPGRGGYWESGAAFSLGKIIVTSGPDVEQSTFNALGDEYADDEYAFAKICKLTRVWR